MRKSAFTVQFALLQVTWILACNIAIKIVWQLGLSPDLDWGSYHPQTLSVIRRHRFASCRAAPRTHSKAPSSAPASPHASTVHPVQSSALVSCYSAVEYCAPVWSCSAHTSRVVVQLNSTMRLISSTLRSTPLPWLPVLSNIEPPALRRKAATDKLVEKIVKHDSWPIQPDILSPPLTDDWHPGSRCG